MTGVKPQNGAISKIAWEAAEALAGAHIGIERSGYELESLLERRSNGEQIPEKKITRTEAAIRRFERAYTLAAVPVKQFMGMEETPYSEDTPGLARLARDSFSRWQGALDDQMEYMLGQPGGELPPADDPNLLRRRGVIDTARELYEGATVHLDSRPS